MSGPVKSVVVTGVSTGIGYSTAEVLIRNGFQVFGSVRKPADAERLQRELGTGFRPLLFDVTDEAAIHKAADQVREALGGERLLGLVNNAGIAVNGPLLQVDRNELMTQLQVNLAGPLLMAQAFAPLLGTDPALRGAPGRIVNIGSVAGTVSFPFMGPYTMSKYGLEAFTDTLRRELMIYGIDAILVGPAAVDTPIFGKTVERPRSDFDQALERYRAASDEQRSIALRPEQVAQVILEALTVPRPRARYAVVPAKARAWLIMKLPALLSKRTVDRLFARMLGLTPLERALPQGSAPQR